MLCGHTLYVYAHTVVIQFLGPLMEFNGLCTHVRLDKCYYMYFRLKGSSNFFDTNDDGLSPPDYLDMQRMDSIMHEWKREANKKKYASG